MSFHYSTSVAGSVGGDRGGLKVEYERANDDVVHVIVARQTVNDGSASTSVVGELPARLPATFSRVMETIGVRPQSDAGLSCGVDGPIGSRNDLLDGENDFIDAETARLDRENGVTGGENDLLNDENGRADGENGRLHSENNLMNGENDRDGGENDRVDREIGGMDQENGRGGDANDRVNGANDPVNREISARDDDNGRIAGETPLHFDVVIVVGKLNVEHWREGDGGTKPRVQGFVPARDDCACGWDAVKTTVTSKRMTSSPGR